MGVEVDGGCLAADVFGGLEDGDCEFVGVGGEGRGTGLDHVSSYLGKEIDEKRLGRYHPSSPSAYNGDSLLFVRHDDNCLSRSKVVMQNLESQDFADQYITYKRVTYGVYLVHSSSLLYLAKYV